MWTQEVDPWLPGGGRRLGAPDLTAKEYGGPLGADENVLKLR